MDKFKVGDTAWVKVVLREHGNNNYPLAAISVGRGYGTFTSEGKHTITDEHQTLFTEDEAREILGIKKPKDEMRYFYVHFFTKDVNDDIRHLSLCVTSQGMFSKKSLYAHLSDDVKSIISFMQIISWQELTKDDYEAFTS